MSLIGAAIVTLLIGFRKVVGSGYFLPVSSATQLFATALLAMHTADRSRRYFWDEYNKRRHRHIMSLLFRYLHFIFDLRLAGFTTMLLRIWISVLGESTPRFFRVI